MDKAVQEIPHDIYAVLQNVDSSLLFLNPFLYHIGFEVQFIPIQELEDKFYKLFISEKTESSEKIRFDDGSVINSSTYEAIKKHPRFGFRVIQDKGCYFLKSLIKSKVTIIRNSVQTDNINDLVVVRSFTESFINQLRLYKEGDITSCIVFQIQTEGNQIALSFDVQMEYIGHKKYELSEFEAEEIGRQLIPDFKPQAFLKLAWERFQLSYRISDTTIRFFTLNVVLEAIFKKWTDNAGHQISRCSAFIITQDYNEGKKWYTEIKGLYKTRSKIAHGGDAKEDIEVKLNKIEFVVRCVLKYAIQSKHNSVEELCEFLDESAPTE